VAVANSHADLVPGTKKYYDWFGRQQDENMAQQRTILTDLYDRNLHYAIDLNGETYDPTIPAASDAEAAVRPAQVKYKYYNPDQLKQMLDNADAQIQLKPKSYDAIGAPHLPTQAAQNLGIKNYSQQTTPALFQKIKIADADLDKVENTILSDNDVPEASKVTLQNSTKQYKKLVDRFDDAMHDTIPANETDP
jgi:hypothetical protein